MRGLPIVLVVAPPAQRLAVAAVALGGGLVAGGHTWLGLALAPLVGLCGAAAGCSAHAVSCWPDGCLVVPRMWLGRGV